VVRVTLLIAAVTRISTNFELPDAERHNRLFSSGVARRVGRRAQAVGEAELLLAVQFELGHAVIRF